MLFSIFCMSYCKSQSNYPSKLSLLSKEWNLEYQIGDEYQPGKTLPYEEKKYRFDSDGTFYEKDGINIGKGKWKLNSDSTGVCWNYQVYNQKEYYNDECKDFRYTIIELNKDSLKLAIDGRHGTAYYMFSNSKK